MARENNPFYQTIIKADSSITPLDLKNIDYNPRQHMTTMDVKVESWKDKILHGTHQYHLSQEHIDKLASNMWLKTGNIYPETEGFMIAIQDRVIKTRNYAKYIMKENISEDKCRRCHKASETIEHVTSACTSLAPSEYTTRHDNVCKIIHKALVTKYSLADNIDPWYRYKPETIHENGQIKLYWNRDILTDHTIAHNRPDITLINKQTKTTYLIDIAVPNTHNIQQKHMEKVGKYLPLAEEIKQMWRQDKVVIVPIIISTTGIIPKQLHNSIQTLDLHTNIYKELQKAVIINTCSIVRRFLNITNP